VKRALFVFAALMVGCSHSETSHKFSTVHITDVFTDSVSIRAIEFLDENTLAFAGSGGLYGTVDIGSHTVRTNVQQHDSIIPAFRAVAHTSADFFMLSAGNPALLYKTGDKGQMQLVYTEEGEGVFYDSMKFWNDAEGIAIGDTVHGCLSVLITRDGGDTWKKLHCNALPTGIEGEGAFAASNTNIAIVGKNTWIGTTEGRVFFSPDKGHTWELIQTPIASAKPTEGIYSLDFYDKNTGFGIGGDYTQPEINTANKIGTTDGGRHWKLMASGEVPEYKSCVQYVPNSDGKDLVALGFTGIAYSKDGGNHWVSLSDAPFYTLRFLNDSIAYAAGRNRIAKLRFQ